MHGGINDEMLIDFSISVNPFIPDFVVKALKESVKYEKMYTYVEWLEDEFRKKFGIDSVIVAGATEAFHIIGWTFMKDAVVIIPEPNYTEYERVARFSASKIVKIRVFQSEEDYFERIDKVIFEERKNSSRCVLITGNPNNPTGEYTDFSDFAKDIYKKYGKEVLIILDEAFIDFVPKDEQFELCELDNLDNLIIVRTFTKILGVPGVRIGYVKSRSFKEIFEKYRMPWGIGGSGYAVLKSLMENFDDYEAFLSESSEYFKKEREEFKNFSFFNSKTNYLVIDVGDSEEFQKFMHRNGLHVRTMEDFGMDGFVRVGLKDRVANEKLRRLVEEWYFHRGVEEKTAR